MSKLIIQKRDNIYSVYLPSTAKTPKNFYPFLERTEVQTCNLLAGKSYQITESLEIWLEPSLCLCFREQKQVDYKLELHPRLVDYYLVEIKKEYWQALIKNDFCHTVALKSEEVQDWNLENYE